MPLHQGLGYIRVVDRHLLPHVRHRVDATKPFYASGKASGALAMTHLPAIPIPIPVRCMLHCRVDNNSGKQESSCPHIVPSELSTKRQPRYYVP